MRQSTTSLIRVTAERPRRCEPTRQAGFTLIELLVVMFIIVILMAIGMPSYHNLTTSNRVATEANGLLGEMQYARSEAVREGQAVTVCISKDGATCDSASTTWQEGWIVFSDVKDDQTVDSGDTVLRVQHAFSGTDTFTSSNTAYSVTFTREGFATGAGGLKITLNDAANDTDFARCLEIAVGGQMAVQSNSTDSSCT